MLNGTSDLDKNWGDKKPPIHGVSQQQLHWIEATRIGVKPQHPTVLIGMSPQVEDAGIPSGKLT
jgi:hypothetical protein